MRYESIKKYDCGNGTGLRTSIFFTGCTLRCKGCFNSDIWDFKAGKIFDEEAKQKVISLVADPHCSGLSILGGEPTDQGEELIELMKEIHDLFDGTDKTIWLWSGRTKEEIEKKDKRFLDFADILVDGPFIEESKNLNLSWRGSENQHIYKKNNLGIWKMV